MMATPGQLAAAILLPPLGVYLAGGGTRDFAMACGLTMTGFVPGVGYALWRVLAGQRPALT